jgi:hypothetical protein
VNAEVDVFPAVVGLLTNRPQLETSSNIQIKTSNQMQQSIVKFIA